MIDVDRDEQILYEELAVLYYISAETYKRLENNRKYSVISIQLNDGTKVHQLDIYKRLKTVVLPYTLRHLPFIKTDEKKAYECALTYTDIQKKLRDYWRVKDDRFFHLPIEQMKKVVKTLDLLPGNELYIRLKAELERLSEGLQTVINRGY